MKIMCYIDEDVMSIKDRCSSCVNVDSCAADAATGSFSTLDLGESCRGFERRKDNDDA